MSGFGQPASTTVEAAESRCKSLLFQGMREQAALQFVDAGVAGVQVLSPRLFDGIRHGAFSMNKLWDEAIASGRIQAIVHDGPSSTCPARPTSWRPSARCATRCWGPPNT